MKTVELANEKHSLEELLAMAHVESLLIRTSQGEEFVLGAADDLEVEAEALGRNEEFLAFLEARRRNGGAVSLADARIRLLSD